MLKSIRERAREVRAAEFEGEEAAEAGFTLIELMVVLLIIAILLAIAIPTFLGVTNAANDRAAQSNLTNALTEMKALYQNGQTYDEVPAPAASLSSQAPEFSWNQGGSCSAGAVNCVSEYPVDVSGPSDGNGVILAVWSKNQNTCWYVVDLEAAPQATAFTGGDVAVAPNTPTVQFLGATTGVNGEEESGAAAAQAGVYYSKWTNQTSCNATTPTTAGPWNWGNSYANAPNQ
ncbi:MAG TPA: prepilin-type N-terminal cleavage/methylation domain-containing protein [Acidimicrobiales bacterium]|nr:prepilin-type N-terminal cleavage/methylation domain-containing protein [Acidimicrobiales bacterium]